jgi:hypothetical protein
MSAQAAFSATPSRRRAKQSVVNEKAIRWRPASSRFFRDTSMAQMQVGAPLGRRGQTSSLESWRRSARFRGIARQNAKILNAKVRPRCGAARKRDGKPCGNAAMKNGRCSIHGGKTPSGRQWHIVQYPDCSTPAGAAKFHRKLRQQERDAANRALRLAAMTPDQRAKHDAWHRSHRPGPVAARSVQRARAGQNAQTHLLVDLGPSQPTTDPESIRIERLLAVAKARLAVLDARTTKPSNDDEGIFT